METEKIRLRKALVKKFREHGINIEGSELQEYSKEELLKLKDALSELETKHNMSVQDLLNGLTLRVIMKHSGIPILQGFDESVRSKLKNDKLFRHLNDCVVSTKLRKKEFLEFLNDCIEKYAQHKAKEILESHEYGKNLLSDLLKDRMHADDKIEHFEGLKEIEYKGKKIRLTEEDLARFLKEHGLKHAEKIYDKINNIFAEKIVEEILKEAQNRELKSREKMRYIT